MTFFLHVNRSLVAAAQANYPMDAMSCIYYTTPVSDDGVCDESIWYSVESVEKRNAGGGNRDVTNKRSEPTMTTPQLRAPHWRLVRGTHPAARFGGGEEGDRNPTQSLLTPLS